MTKKNKLTIDDVKKVAGLASLPLTGEEITLFIVQLSAILDFISKLQKIDTHGVQETSQVTGLENVLREDVIDAERMFSQKQALANAKGAYNGFFKVPKILWT